MKKKQETPVIEESFKDKVHDAMKELLPEHLTCSVQIKEDTWNENRTIFVDIDIEYDGKKISTWSDSFTVKDE